MTKTAGQANDPDKIIDLILKQRGVTTRTARQAFLHPDYEAAKHDPFLLPDMAQAIDRLKIALDNDELITIYGDYDVDGITATALLSDALPKFGFHINTYMPNRFSEGYGLNVRAVEQLAAAGTNIILTVDNGIVSFDEVARASALGVDVIVTDHHSPRDQLPDAVAVVDMKITAQHHVGYYDEHYLIKERYRKAASAEKLYPFCDLCGCGVAFKLVQALQTTYPDKLPLGQEKWLLDLVALGTVSDVVSLADENRAYVKWGLEVIKRTRRPGIRALAAVAGLELADVDARAIGFVLGPRLNASGRLKTATLATELLATTDNSRALELAEELNVLNDRRKQLQNEIYSQAVEQIDPSQPVAIAVGDDWHEGVVGIVASKVEERFERPAFIFSRNGEYAKASGRSFGGFSVAAALTETSELLIKGGGHKAAGGLTVARDRFKQWCDAVQAYYRSLHLTDQTQYLYPAPDVTLDRLDGLTPELVRALDQLEPFGAANPVPVFELAHILVQSRRTMGAAGQHVKYTLVDVAGNHLDVVAFNAADRFTLEPFNNDGAPQYADALVELSLNEWRGSVTVQGRLIKLDPEVAKV